MNFPHVKTTFRLDRRVSKLDGSQLHRETVYGITSLKVKTKQDAERLLGLVRGHWSIESLHWIRDVTYGEDKSQIRTGNGPRMMATLRNLAISMLRLAGASSIKKAQRWCSRSIDACCRLIGLPT